MQFSILYMHTYGEASTCCVWARNWLVKKARYDGRNINCD